MATPRKRPGSPLLSPIRKSPRIESLEAKAKEIEARIERESQFRKLTTGAQDLVLFASEPRLASEPGVRPRDPVEYERNLAKQRTNWNRFLIKRAEQVTTSHAIAELFTIGQSDLSLLMFRPERVALWETNYGTLRDIFEISAVPAQCNNTIGPFVPGVTPCWICGMVIPFATDNLKCGHENGLAGECEHILPIAQASIFLQLYDAKNNNSALFPLEYAWSHKLCNRTKNQDVYFRNELDDRGVPIIDEAQFGKLLSNIYNTIRADSTCSGYVDQSFKNLLRNYVGPNVKEWKQTRIAAFRERYTKIIDFIGGKNFQSSPELYILALAAAPAAIVNRLDPVRKATLGFGRRTRRRRHQSMRMSSKRHSLSGRPARR